MEVESASLKLVSRLTSFLLDKPDLPNLLNFLSLNISPFGDICAVTLKVADEAEYREVSSDQITYSFDIDSTESYDSRALRTSCSIPLGENLYMAFTFENPEYLKKHEDSSISIRDYETYFECIQAILKFYLAFHSKKFLSGILTSKKLSPRQLLIHKMMVTGKTNRQIATDLSYSVSLIRQETMSIYLKLGIDGRKEIKRDQKAAVKDLTDEITSNTDKDQ